MAEVRQHFGVKRDEGSFKPYVTLRGGLDQQIKERDPKLYDRIHQLRRRPQNFLGVEQYDGELIVQINPSVIGEQSTSAEVQRNAGRALRVLGVIQAWIHHEQRDQAFSMSIGKYPNTQGYLETNATVKRPDGINPRITGYASTVVMRSVAGDLGIDGIPYAKIDARRGARLELDESTRAGLSTSRAEFEYDRTSLQLRGHEIHDPAQQLVLISGAIAVANAAELSQQLEEL